MVDVLYLCYSEQKEGLVFPNELEDNYYSPGMWTIIKNSYKNERIRIDAINNGKIITLDGKLVNNEIYMINTEFYNPIYCRVIEIYSRYNKYVGNNKMLNEAFKFYQLVPINVTYIENLCLEHKFYLVGKINNFEIE